MFASAPIASLPLADDPQQSAILALVPTNSQTGSGGARKRSRKEEDAEFWAAYEKVLAEGPAKTKTPAEKPKVAEVRKAYATVKAAAPEVAEAAEIKSLVALEAYVRQQEEAEEKEVLSLLMGLHKQDVAAEEKIIRLLLAM